MDDYWSGVSLGELLGVEEITQTYRDEYVAHMAPEDAAILPLLYMLTSDMHLALLQELYPDQPNVVPSDVQLQRCDHWKEGYGKQSLEVDAVIKELDKFEVDPQWSGIVYTNDEDIHTKERYLPYYQTVANVIVRGMTKFFNQTNVGVLMHDHLGGRLWPIVFLLHVPGEDHSGARKRALTHYIRDIYIDALYRDDRYKRPGTRAALLDDKQLAVHMSNFADSLPKAVPPGNQLGRVIKALRLKGHTSRTPHSRLPVFQWTGQYEALYRESLGLAKEAVIPHVIQSEAVENTMNRDKDMLHVFDSPETYDEIIPMPKSGVDEVPPVSLGDPAERLCAMVFPREMLRTMPRSERVLFFTFALLAPSSLSLLKQYKLSDVSKQKVRAWFANQPVRSRNFPTKDEFHTMCHELRQIAATRKVGQYRGLKNTTTLNAVNDAIEEHIRIAQPATLIDKIIEYLAIVHPQCEAMYHVAFPNNRTYNIDLKLSRARLAVERVAKELKGVDPTTSFALTLLFNRYI